MGLIDQVEYGNQRDLNLINMKGQNYQKYH